MADKHPYVSGPGAIIATVNQFRKSIPPKVTAETLTKLGIAPNNESYVINVLRFIGVVDAEADGGVSRRTRKDRLMAGASRAALPI